VTGRDFVHRGFGGVAVPADIASSVVLTRTRAGAAALAATWTDARLVADHYAWQLWTGVTRGHRLTVCSTGTGSATAAIGIEELAILGARTFLAVGATAAAHDDARVIVAEGAVRADAASHGYARPGYPAAADIEVVMAAVAVVRGAGLSARPAIVVDPDAELDAIAGLGGNPGTPTAAARALDAAIAAGAIPVRGSPSTLLVQAGVHGLRAGFLAAADTPVAQARLAALATAALVRLAAWDGDGVTQPTPVADRILAVDPHPQP
jgi:uridine phosphorylase